MDRALPVLPDPACLESVLLPEAGSFIKKCISYCSGKREALCQGAASEEGLPADGELLRTPKQYRPSHGKIE